MIFSAPAVDEREAARLRVPLLGKVPIDIALRESGDVGRPLAASDPNGVDRQGFQRDGRSNSSKVWRRAEQARILIANNV